MKQIKVTLRKPDPTKDLNFLMDLDTKSHEHPWDKDAWMKVFAEAKTMIGDSNRNPVCSVVLRRRKVKFDKKQEPKVCINIERLSVWPDKRGKSIGTALLNWVEKAANIDHVPLVTTAVPAHRCGPKAILDVGSWLNKRGYKARKVLHDRTTYCGEPEDLYIFSKEINLG